MKKYLLFNSHVIVIHRNFVINRLMIFLLLMNMIDIVIAQPSKLACEKGADVTEVSLEELMDTSVVSSASEQAACTHEAANIISSISGEEILSRGARDLTDVLQLVPSFVPGIGFNNAVGMGVRGIQADEGKMSVFIDGIMLTERAFGTTQFGGHFPLEQIDHVEIIRGSSSIQNDNFAEVGLINIITKNAKQANGVKITANYGRFERGEARKNVSLNAGKVFDDLEISFSGKANESQRSDSHYFDAHNNSFDMANNSQIDSMYGNLHIKYKALNIRLLSDQYAIEGRDGYADQMSPANTFLKNYFQTHAAKTSFEHFFNANLKVNANFDFSRQLPWERRHFYDNELKPNQMEEKVVNDNYKYDVKATWMADSGSYLVLGSSYQTDDYGHSFPQKNFLPTFTDYTAYSEGVYKTDWVDILLGLRFDEYNHYGNNLAPRLALTKQLDKFHYKLLYTHAFHAPTVGGYQLNDDYNNGGNKLGRTVPQMTPEKTYTYEVELGYEPLQNLELIGNAFYTEIAKIFTYTFDKNWDDYYINSKGLATFGVEAEIKYKNSQLGRFDLGYSFYQSARNTSSNYYQATSSNGVIHPNMNLGFPTHKATLNHTFNITPDFSFNHTLVFYSDRFGYSGSNVKHYNPDWIYNLYFRYQNMPVKGAEFGLGLYDVFNERYQYVQQYNGSHPALPAESRELMLRFSYQF